MSFLNPFVLLALVAAGIPLIIHLFNFRRPRRIDFSTLTFVRELQKSTMQRVRLKQWLLLLLRTLALVMLVLSFARPTLTGGIAAVIGGQGNSAVALVVDDSPSMALRDVRGAYINQARDLARAVVGQLESGDEIHLFTTSGDASVPRRHQNARSALDAIEAIDVRLNARPVRAVLNEALTELGDSDHLNHEVYFVGDLQRSTLGDSLALRASSDAAVLLMPVGSRAHPNVAIEEVRVESPILEVGAPARLMVRARNFGAEPVSDYNVSVYLGDERVAQAPVDLQPGITSEVSLVVTPQQRGWLSGRVEGEDDAFVADNTRFFTMHVPEQRRVLLVGGTEQETRYIRLALTTGGTGSESFFRVESLASQDVANRLPRLGEYEAVVLAGTALTSSGEASALAQYVANGGGLFVTPGRNQELAHLNRLLEELGGGRVTGIEGSRGGAEAIASFDRVDAEHPIFQGVFDAAASDGERDIERPRIYAVARYDAPTGAEQTLISLTNGIPFLQELRHGNGGAFILTVAPEPTWSDLPVRGLFVPMIYRALQYLSASDRVQGEDVVAGGSAELRLTGVTEREPVRLVSPFGEEQLPDARAMPGAVLVRLNAQDWVPGIYELFAGDRLVRRIAANVDRRESDLKTAAPDSLARVFEEESGATIRVLNAAQLEPGALDREIRGRRSGLELWNVFLMLALLLLITEMIVARQWRPEAVPS